MRVQLWRQLPSVLRRLCPSVTSLHLLWVATSAWVTTIRIDVGLLATPEQTSEDLHQHETHEDTEDVLDGLLLPGWTVEVEELETTEHSLLGRSVPLLLLLTLLSLALELFHLALEGVCLLLEGRAGSCTFGLLLELLS